MSVILMTLPKLPDSNLDSKHKSLDCCCCCCCCCWWWWWWWRWWCRWCVVTQSTALSSIVKSDSEIALPPRHDLLNCWVFTKRLIFILFTLLFLDIVRGWIDTFFFSFFFFWLIVLWHTFGIVVSNINVKNELLIFTLIYVHFRNLWLFLKVFLQVMGP